MKKYNIKLFKDIINNISIQLICEIEENTKIFFRRVWFNPPKAPKMAENAAEIIKIIL